MVWIIDNLVSVLELFLGVAGNGLVEPILLLVSIGILVTALGSFGVLAIGGILSALSGS
jgi:hypothetical protein